MFHANPCLAAMPAGYLFAEVASRVKAYRAQHPEKELLLLGIGDVTRPLPETIADEMSAAAAQMATPEGFHGYGPDFGYDFLIDAIIKGDYAARGVSISQGEVFISDGSKCDVGNLQELFAQDTRVAVTDPVYPVYVDSNAMAGRAGAYSENGYENIEYLPVCSENGFVPPLPKTDVDVIYLCYPNNPTGTVLSKAQLNVFVDYAKAHGCIIIYDAAYKAFIQGEDIPRSIYEIEGAKDVAIECCSFSKTAGFTGVRCAYTVIPEGLCGLDGQNRPVSLNKLWKRRTATKFNGVSYPVQRAAAAVYTKEGQAQIQQTIDYYRKNAQTILQGLRSAKLSAFGGEHAPYIWLKTPENMPSWAFFDLLLNEANVVGTPGAGFGPCGEGYFRLTAFNTHDKTAAAVERIRGLFAK